MFRNLLAASIVVAGTLVGQAAFAGEYTVAVGTPQTGTSIPPGRVGLGIAVPVDKSWAALSNEEKQEWRNYTELLDPDVTPPFPSPNIRSLLRKIEVLPQFETDMKVERRDEIYLVVRIGETGIVNTVEIIRGADPKAKELADMEKLLAYRYVNALLKTKFSPALLNGTPVASAFPMLIRSVTKLH